MPSEVSAVAADHDRGRTVESLTEELSRARAERDEAQQQQAATTEVLQLISSSPTETGPVFKTILEHAVSLCDAAFGVVYRFDGQLIHIVAHHNFTEDATAVHQSHFPSPPGQSTVTSRAILERGVVQVEDMSDENLSTPWSVTIARQLGYRGIISVPMLREGVPIGTVTLAKRQRGFFTDKQVGLLKTFADQAVIAIENTRLFEAEQASKRELQESLKYQTAISDVLGVISRSPSQIQPVFDAIVTSAKRLLGAHAALVTRVTGRRLELAAFTPVSPEADEEIQRFFPRQLDGTFGPVVTAARECIPIMISDTETDGRMSPVAVEVARRRGYRSMLIVPMVSKGVAIGTINVLRPMPGPFSDHEIELLKTFADQAVIAIENTRLFEEVQARTKELEGRSAELQETLTQQMATADVLKVISRSPSNVQPVLDAVVTTAARLCDALDATIWLRDGKTVVLQANTGQLPTLAGGDRRAITREWLTGCAVAEARTIHVPDLLHSDEYPQGKDIAARHGHRATLVVPMLRDGIATGAIVVRRSEPCPFTDKQIALLETFADQAVIAIENTRLFEEVQARTHELQESLEYQTAISNVLGVISASPHDVRPAYQNIVETACRLCKADRAGLWRLEDDGFRPVARANTPLDLLPVGDKSPLDRSSLAGRVGLDGRTVHIPDILADPEYDKFRSRPDDDRRSMLGVPLLRQGQVIGAIILVRTRLEPFSSAEIQLVETFADQAVIAVENTRLFEAEQASKRELSESLEYQTATSELLKVIGRSTFDLQPVFNALAESAVKLCDAERSLIYRLEGSRLRAVAGHNATDELMSFLAQNPMPLTRASAAGRACLEKSTIHIEDVLADPEYTYGATQVDPVRTVLAIPMLKAKELLGVLVIYRQEVRPFTGNHVTLMETFADQAVIAIENTRLFEEVQARTRELAKTVEDLEIASQHKSQFVANMSHELRTPLAAILGYAELMQEGFYGALSDKSTDALTRIRSNGKHLLGLINTVLDIAKIESGQFSLNLGEYAIESVVETVRAATESLAETKKLALRTDVAKKLPFGLGDEQRLTQVLLNLVGNAIKFTDTGEVRITATAANGQFAVSVTDTGPGIPEEHRARIFEQFHQVDNSNTKAKGGTGLGLAIAKQIVEMHGGRIWVESTVGKGSTFQMQLPIRAEVLKAAE